MASFLKKSPTMSMMCKEHGVGAKDLLSAFVYTGDTGHYCTNDCETSAIDDFLLTLRESMVRNKPKNLLHYLKCAVDEMSLIHHNKASCKTSVAVPVPQKHALISPCGRSSEDAVPCGSPGSRPARRILSSVFSHHILHPPSVDKLQTSSSTSAGSPPSVQNGYFGIDIGGTLSKILFFEPAPSLDPVALPSSPPTGNDNSSPSAGNVPARTAAFLNKSTTYGSSGVRDEDLAFSYQGGKFSFVKFQTGHMRQAIQMLKENRLHEHQTELLATGGGAYKFAKQFQEELGIMLVKRDEIRCLIAGLNFMLEVVPDEAYYLTDPARPFSSPRVVQPCFTLGAAMYPYLLVNIGSGVSIIRVDSQAEYSRVGGSCIGGGTYWGLMKQLTGATDFGMAIEASRTGKPEHVDMLVGDIYGGDYANFGLSSTTVASAFGKLMRSNVGGVMPGDIASSLLHMIASNIGQLAYLYAQQHNCERILFAGNFLRTNSMSAGFIGTSIRYYSKNKMQALFLKHEGYFGAIGAFLSTMETETESSEK